MRAGAVLVGPVGPAGAHAAPDWYETEGEAITRMVDDLVTAAGGSISAEHGIGTLKVGKLPHYKSPVALRLMQAVKKALDPQNIMNPGKVLA